MVNKVIKKFFIIVLLFSFGIAVSSSKITVNASSQLYDEKIYCELDDNIEFENDSIIVIMDKLLSEKNKVHSLNFFGVDLFEDIIDLTYGNINILNDDFEQILELKLRKKNRDGVLEAIDILENIQGIKYAGPNKIYSFNQSSNDTYYVSNDLWAIDEMHVPEAWDYSTGSSEVRIGVIDSGIASHPDLNANVITGFDFVSDNTVTNDDIVGHGTHVAGIIGAIGNNNRGVSGVNWNATIVPLQVATSQGGVNDSACVEAVNHATESYNTDNPIRILNFSISGYSEWPEMETAISQYPGLFVCTAGNDGINTAQNYSYPGFYGTNLHDSPLNNIFVVGAIDENDERSVWNLWRSSNYGTNTVDIYAPGSNIVSTYPENMYDSSDDNHIARGYYNTGGTSMAAPYVTGVAALLLSINPNLTTSQLKNAIINSAENIDITIPDSSTQNVKKLNAYNAVKYVLCNYSSSMDLYRNTISMNKNVDSLSDYYDVKNAFVKLNVLENSVCNFTITSTNALSVTLYDSNFNEINIYPTSTNSNTSVTLYKILNSGVYYLKVNYAVLGSFGNINVSVSSAHDHVVNYWFYYSNIAHRGRCSCGDFVVESHVVKVSEIVDNKAPCLGCLTMLDLRYDQAHPVSNTQKVSVNGSYILPNGIIVLVDEDIDAYYDGTLVFYNKDDILVTQ